MKSKQFISVVLSIAMILSLVVIMPLQAKAADISELGTCDSSKVTGSYSTSSTEDYFEYTLTVAVVQLLMTG